MLDRLIARQLRRPSGLVGRHLLPRLWNRHNAALHDATLEQMAPAPGQQLLEVGFGGGRLLAKLLDRVGESGRVHGVDVSAATARFCRWRFRPELSQGRLELHVAPAEQLPLPDASVDGAGTVNTLFYLDDPKRAFAECHRVLRPQGRLVVCFTARASLPHKSFAQHGLLLLEPEQLCNLLVEVGFDRPKLRTDRDRHRRFHLAVAKR